MTLKTGALTDQEHRTLAGEDISGTYLVEAGAGTGKTTILVKRFTELITSGADIEDIVAITFTEKAAAEMITRIRDGLEEALNKAKDKNDKDIILIERYRRALDRFNLNRISTIHSFSSSILKENPFEAGIDPFLNVDNAYCSQVFEQVWDQWVEDQLKIDDNPIKLAVEAGVNQSGLIQLVKYAYDNRDFFSEYHPIHSDFDINEFISVLNAIAENLNNLQETCCINKNGDASWKEFKKLNTLVKELKHKTPLEMELIILRMEKFNSKGTQKNWKPKDACKEQKESFKQLDEELQAVKGQISQKIINRCLENLREFYAKIEEEKFKRGILDFQDLLIKTKDLLQNNRAVRNSQKKKIRYLLVDEFQDTDPLQAEIVFFLAEILYRNAPDLIDMGEKRADESGSPLQGIECGKWDECSITRGKLFIVGDPKQSIYRFRRADIEIYEKVKDLIRQNQGAILDIIVNFRSLRPIVDWVNNHFSRIIKKPEDGNYQSHYTPLVANKESDPGIPSLVMLKVDEKVQVTLEKTEHVRRAEAAAVGEFIKNLVEEKKYLIRDKKGGSHQVSYRDIAILFPKTTNIDIYEEALASRQIPYLLEAGRLFYGRPEVISMVSALKSIDNPCDEIALVSFLKSPMAGISDEEILQLILNGCSVNYLEDNGKIPENIAIIFKKLREFYEMRGTHKTSHLLELILQWTNYREYCIITGDQDRPLANIEKFLSIAREYEKSRRGTLRAFIRDIDQKMRDEEMEADAPLAESDSDAVMMMTMHKSKGLEFPVVIPVNTMTAKGGRGADKFFIDRENNAFEADLNPLKTPGLDRLKEYEEKRLYAEEARLIYVTCTRAMNMLVLPCIAKFNPKEGKPVFAGMQKHLVDTFLMETPDIAETFEFEEYHQEELERNPSRFKDISIVEADAGDLNDFREKRAEWQDCREKILQKASESQKIRSYSTDKESVEEPGERLKVETIPLRIGRAYHAVMENIDFNNWKNLDEVVESACKDEGISGETGVVKELANKTLLSDVIKKAKRPGVKYRKEFPFTIDINGQPSWGYIDLLISWNKGFLIVDYKSDDIGVDEIPAIMETEYRNQAELYKMAIEKLTKKPVERICYYFARPGVTYEVSSPGILT